MIDFKEKLRLLSDSELLEVIKSKDDYQEDFWNLAILDAEKRGLKSKCDKILDDINKKKVVLEKVKQKKQTYDSNRPELYSEKAIIAFSLFFSSIAGAILFSQNLKTLNKEGRDKVIAFGILYFVGLIVLAYIIPSKSLQGLSYILNIAGGYIITIYFGGKYYPENLDYKNKKIWKALAVAILISAILFGIIYLTLINKL
jgi:hypothetical protein